MEGRLTMAESREGLVSREALAVSQFGPRAGAYVASAVHSGGADLDRLSELAALARPAHALDLGAGGGHVAYRLAAAAQRVTAVDLSADMLRAVAEEAGRRGLANVETLQASVERLPLPDAACDFLASRFSAHHWRDAAAGLREARRVLRRGAPALFIDIVLPGPAAPDTHLQTVETLRDSSHVRDYSCAEWAAMLAGAGFALRNSRTWRLRMDFESWTARIRTPAPLSQAIRLLQQGADEELTRFFGIESDGSFWLDAACFETEAA